MTFFDENGPYWGDKIVPLIAEGEERLSARSVKIFADGGFFIDVDTLSDLEFFPFGVIRGVEDWWCCCMSFVFFWIIGPQDQARLRSHPIFSQLYEPYADNPSTRGAMRISAEVLNTVIPRFLRDGWQVVSRVFCFSAFNILCAFYNRFPFFLLFWH
jgi:hypothetical protein